MDIAYLTFFLNVFNWLFKNNFSKLSEMLWYQWKFRFFSGYRRPKNLCQTVGPYSNLTVRLWVQFHFKSVSGPILDGHHVDNEFRVPLPGMHNVDGKRVPFFS